MEELKVETLIKSDYKYRPRLKVNFEDIEVGAFESPNCQIIVCDLGKLSSVK